MHVPVDSDDDNSSDEEDEEEAGNGRFKEEGGKGTGTGGGDGVDAAAIHLSDLSLFDPELGHRQGSNAGENLDPLTYRNFPRNDS